MIHIMETKNENIRPFVAVHPGSVLKDELEARGISLGDFAHDAGMSLDALKDILEEKNGIDALTASAFERELGISASFWLALQKDYVEDAAYLERKNKKSKVHTLIGKLPWNKVAL